ncbi:MAG TPA: glycosyltransferase [Actinomycetota bacterium]|nr:glycosyltransferase [Actinomycetota bacterium]
MKLLILTASVGEGHNAAARAVSDEIRELDPAAEVQVENGLAVVGAFWEKFVIDGYKIQLDKAQWSYSWLYWSIVKSKKVTYFYKGLCAVIGCRKIHRLIEASQPDIVLSTYPLTSAMLASLKRRGKITMPCANLVTDFAPHPMWMYPDLDDNYVMHISTVETVASMMEPSPTTVVAPLVARRFLGPSRRASARAELGVPDDAFVAMVIGGGWGVGNIERSARAVATVDGVWTLVVCGKNESLKAKLDADPPPRTIVCGYVTNMPDLIDACDLAVQNAGGLTSLEALRRGCPLLITDAIPGHGVANGELMDRVGVARYVRDVADLPAAVAACRDDPGLRARAERLAVGFAELPSAGSALVDLHSGARSRAAVGLPDHLHPETDPAASSGRPQQAGPARRNATTPTGSRAGKAGGRHRLRWLSATGVALVALFVLLTSGTSVSFAGGHLGLPVVERAGTVPAGSVVLCIRMADTASVNGLPALLADHGAQATFFLPAGDAAGASAFLADYATAGEIQNGGVGGVSRLSTPSAVRRQVDEGSEDVRGATGHAPIYYLPAHGSLTPAAYLAARAAHLRGVVGSLWIHNSGGASWASHRLRSGDVVVLDLTRTTPAGGRAMLGAFLAEAASHGLHVVDLSASGAALPA